jgi:hypothetical protein
MKERWFSYSTGVINFRHRLTIFFLLVFVLEIWFSISYVFLCMWFFYINLMNSKIFNKLLWIFILKFKFRKLIYIIKVIWWDENMSQDVVYRSWHHPKLFFWVLESFLFFFYLFIFFLLGFESHILFWLILYGVLTL